MACHKNYAALKKNMHSKKISMQILLDLKDLKKRKIERVSIFFNVAIFPKKIFIFDPTLSPCMVAPLNLPPRAEIFKNEHPITVDLVVTSTGKVQCPGCDDRQDL